ncbi:MAG TPA: hypothetical protein VGJ61_04900, partial [Solirubrobacterales bacterium]
MELNNREVALLVWIAIAIAWMIRHRQRLPPQRDRAMDQRAGGLDADEPDLGHGLSGSPDRDSLAAALGR